MKRQKNPVRRHFHGWKRDKPDHRDLQFTDLMPEAFIEQAQALPTSTDLEKAMPHVYDQGSEGSCTANGVVALLQWVKMRAKVGAPMASRNFNYYWSRYVEGTANQDAGASCRDAIQVLTKRGWVTETPDWPYTTDNMLVMPPVPLQQKALQNRVSPVKYARVAIVEQQIKTALAAGLPVYLGADVFQGLDSEEAEATGYVPYPARGEQPIGGHAFVLVGYDDATKRYKWRNSWGTDWGVNGYGYFDYAYIHNTQITGDAWVMTQA